MPAKIITPDYTIRDFRLCWKSKTGGWGSSHHKRRTAESMERVLVWLRKLEPNTEFWAEEQES